MRNTKYICRQCTGPLSRNNSSGVCQKCKSSTIRKEDVRNKGMLCSSCKEKPRRVYSNGTISSYCVDCKSKITSYKHEKHCVVCNTNISRSSDTGYCLSCYTKTFRLGDRICRICNERQRHIFPSKKVAAYCITCLNERSRQRRKNPSTRYSILKIGWRRAGMTTVPTKEQYERMLQEANGICPACGREPRNKEIGLNLHHNHTTGHWVGLLCPHCNAALGYMDDSSILLRRLHEYVLRMGYTSTSRSEYPIEQRPDADH